MDSSTALRAAAAAVVCGLAAFAGFVDPGRASVASAPAPAATPIAGTLEVSVRIIRWSSAGSTIVGHGAVTSTLRQADGTTTVKKAPYLVRLRHFRPSKSGRTRTQSVQQEPLCHILFLEIGEVDLTLLGLRVFLRSADPTVPIQLRLQARREGGILGRLFCDLSEGVATAAQAQQGAKLLNAQMKGVKIMQAKATLYAWRTQGAGSALNLFQPAQAASCHVLHLLLGPLHLDLLGLIVDLNKIELDIFGIPGTVLGDVFCALVPPSGGGT